MNRVERRVQSELLEVLLGDDDEAQASAIRMKGRQVWRQRCVYRTLTRFRRVVYMFFRSILGKAFIGAVAAISCSGTALVTGAQADFVYPLFGTNATPTRQTMTLNGNMIPVGIYDRFRVSMNWSTASFQNARQNGARFFITDRMPSFFGFPSGTTFYVNGAPAMNANSTSASARLVWEGQLTQAYQGGAPLYLTVQQLTPGTGATFQAMRVQLIGAGPRCDADIASVGGELVPDGLVSGDDFIAFISAISLRSAVADIAGVGGTVGADGLVTRDDFNVFISAYDQGCE